LLVAVAVAGSSASAQGATEGALKLVYESTTTNIPPGSQASESSYHDCSFQTPAGTKLLGGGVFFQNDTYGDVRAVSSAPFDGSDAGSRPEAWYVTADNGSVNPNISIGEAEVCGHARRVSYPSRTKQLPAESITTVKVSCRAGKHVLGGGGLADAALHQHRLVSSAPFDSGDRDHRPDDGWSVRISNGNTHSDPVTVTAICAKVRHLAYRTKSKTVQGSARGTQAVNCPDGEFALGGGVAQSGPYYVEGFVRSSFDFNDHGRWIGVVDNYQSQAESMKITAICHS
jgi:hypothetical protein